MFDPSYINVYGYTPVGDIIVIALCLIMSVILLQTYFNSKKKIITTSIIVFAMFGAAVTKIIYEMLIYSREIHIMPIHFFRLLHHFILTLVLYMYVQYLHDPLWIPTKVQRKYRMFSLITVIAAMASDIILTITKKGFYVSLNGYIHIGINVFIIVYTLFLFTILYMIIRYRSRIIRPVFWGLLGVNIISMMTLSIQGINRQVSYTTAAYFFPVIAIVFMFHSNPFNIDTGAVSGSYLQSEIENRLERNEDMLLMSCKMSNFSKLIAVDPELKEEFFYFFKSNVKKGILYHFPGDRFVLLIKKNKNQSYYQQVEKMLSDFYSSYEKFGIDFKIIVLFKNEHIAEGQDYIKLIDYVENRIDVNSIHRIDEDDISEFYSSSYILSQLEDIAMKKDLFDKRVIVYCQPVYNISTGKYDTAEALMRLQLDNTGIVYPDQFIGIAEKYELIHSLSLIVLNKTCYAIRDFIEESYDIRRISVNFSAIDIRYEDFCNEVKSIIERNGIPYSTIAIEITESRSDSDFNIMKQRVVQLQKLGMKFYLDDFGTGYSNFERIMELTFDIIKFDRTMLLESIKDKESNFMVSTFANMFDKLDYAVLFEGVENESDENHCIEMKAKYLQGYLYSKPIPIEQLRNFLTKVS